MAVEMERSRGNWDMLVELKRSFKSEREVAQSCQTLCEPLDCSLPGSTIHGIFQARVLAWAAISFSRGSSWPRDWTQVSHIASRHFTIWAAKCKFPKKVLKGELNWGTRGKVLSKNTDEHSACAVDGCWKCLLRKEQVRERKLGISMGPC